MRKLFLIGGIVLSILGCNSEDSNNTQVLKKSAEVEFLIKTRSSATDVKLSKYSPLKNGDSILVSRLDYYLFNLSGKSSNKLVKLDSIYLYSLSKDSAKIYSKSDSLGSTIDSLVFLCGMDSILNNSNPNSFDPNHPLSGSKNMYWVSWSKYRYIVFEGQIKTKDGILRNFSFHTGLAYKEYSRIPVMLSLNSGIVNRFNLVLNIERIFYPSDGGNLDYKTGDLNAHSDLTDGELTQKFATNFANAFTVE